MENRYIHFGIVLGLIAAISAGLLGGVNDFTSKVIAANTSFYIIRFNWLS